VAADEYQERLESERVDEREILQARARVAEAEKELVAIKVCGLWFSVSGLRGVSGLRIRVSGIVFRIPGSEFRVWGSGCRESGLLDDFVRDADLHRHLPDRLGGGEGARRYRGRTRHTLEPLAWHWSHCPGRLVNRGGKSSDYQGARAERQQLETF